MHGDVNIDERKEYLEVSLYFLTDMHSGTYMQYAETADSKSCSNKYNVNKVSYTKIDTHDNHPRNIIYMFILTIIVGNSVK